MVVMAVALVSCHQPWGHWFLGGSGGGGAFLIPCYFYVY